MANKKLMSLKESMAALKTISEDDALELERMAADAQVPGKPIANPANEDGKGNDDAIIGENTETVPGTGTEGQYPSNEEIMDRIETATEELDVELDDQKLSESTKRKIKSVIESKVLQCKKLLEDESAEKQAEFEEDLLDKADDFMGQVAEQWLKENRVALKENVQVKRVQAFVTGFKKLLEENNIELPADTEAEIAAYQGEIEDLRDEVNNLVSEGYKNRKEIKSLRKSLLVEKTINSKALAMSKADRFRKLCEDVSADGDEEKLQKEIDITLTKVDEEQFQGTGNEIADISKSDERGEMNTDGLQVEKPSALSEALKKYRSLK
jgi:hypothetical protein